MVIDLTKVGRGIEMNKLEEMKLKSSHLLKELQNNVRENYNYIIIPISIYNIIETHNMFLAETTEKTEKEKDCLYLVGSLCDFKVYVDMLMPSDQILMRYDKQTMRDIKIDKLLNGIDSEEELLVSVRDFSLENPH